MRKHIQVSRRVGRSGHRFANLRPENTWPLQHAIGMSSGRRLRLVSLDDDPVFPLARLDEIPSGLPAQPELGIRPACLLETNGHLRGDGRMAVQNPQERVTGDTQNLRRSGHRSNERVQAVLVDVASGMRGIAHHHVAASC